MTILGSFLCRQPGTARRSVHRPCRDVLRFLVSAVAGALCGMLLAGVAACEGRASPTHSQRHPNQRLLAESKECHLPAVCIAYSVPAMVTKSILTSYRSWSGGIVAVGGSPNVFARCLGQTIEVANMRSFRKQITMLRQQEVGWLRPPIS